jgi:hypothetical protein
MMIAFSFPAQCHQTDQLDTGEFGGLQCAPIARRRRWRQYRQRIVTDMLLRVNLSSAGGSRKEGLRLQKRRDYGI